MAQSRQGKDPRPEGEPGTDDKEQKEPEGRRPVHGGGVGMGRSQDARNAGEDPVTGTSAHGAGGKKDSDPD